jgi:hypothetical protein
MWPNGRKIVQHLSFKDTPKFTQIGIFGLKIFHLATLQTSNPYLHFCRRRVREISLYLTVKGREFKSLAMWALSCVTRNILEKRLNCSKTHPLWRPVQELFLHWIPEFSSSHQNLVFISIWLDTYLPNCEALPILGVNVINFTILTFLIFANFIVGILPENQCYDLFEPKGP